MLGAFGPARRIVESPNYKWWAYSAIAIGMFLTVMDQSGVNIALPRIAEYFDADIPTVQWITLGYVLSTSAMLMPMGRLSDMIGRKRVYLIGFVIFVAAAAFGGASPTFALLIVAKVLQGIGSAAIQANGMAMITEVFSERERGKALGLYMTVIGTGSISGPIVGGLLVSALDWQWVFYASVPVGLLAMAAALVVLRGGKPTADAGSKQRTFDWPGAALSSGALIAFLLAMTNGHRLGWTAHLVAAGLAVSVLQLAVFIWWERRADDPILDLDFFSNTVFSMGVGARFLSFLGGSAVFFLMPFYLVQGLGYSAGRAGLLMVPGSICMAVIGPLSGRMSDRFGTRWPAVAGMMLSAAAMLTFSRLTVDSPPIHIIGGMMLSGLGMGTFSSPNSSAIMSSLGRARYGIVSAFLNLTRTSANVSGIVLATTVVTLTMGSLGYEPNLSEVSEGGGEGVRVAFVLGLRRAFLVSVGLMIFAMVLSLLRGEASVEMAPAPRAEASDSSSPAVSDD